MIDSQTQRVFLALADPTRRLLLQHLCEEGSGTAASFATRLPITRQAPGDLRAGRSRNGPRDGSGAAVCATARGVADRHDLDWGH
jgi:hypothetical protein